MEYKTVEQLARVAEIRVEQVPTPVMSQSERLQRWAELLEEQPDRRLNTLHGTEYESDATRDALRCANSPISVAFDDPVLRAIGLKDDTYGEAMRFFGISDRELHEVLCYCHYGAAMLAESGARAIRRVIARASHTGVLTRMRQALSQ
jgi:hypothetical protein